MPTFTLTPSNGRIVLDDLLSVGQTASVAVVIAASESRTFETGHAYRLTIKQRGKLDAAPYFSAPLTVTGPKSATVLVNLNTTVILADIGSRDHLAVQIGVADVTTGVLAFCSSAYAIRLGNTPDREGDVSPPTVGHPISAEEVQEIADALDMRLQAIEDDPPGSGTVIGPESSITGHVAIFAGEDGQEIADGGHLGTAAYMDVPEEGNAASNQVVTGGDSRLADARTPTAHAASHATGQADALTPAAIGAHPAQTPIAAAEATGTLALDFAGGLTAPITLTGNISVISIPTGMTSGSEYLVLIDHAGFSLPAAGVGITGMHQGAWDVEGPWSLLLFVCIGEGASRWVGITCSHFGAEVA